MRGPELLLPAPFPIGGLVAPPHVLTPAVTLERLIVFLAVVDRWGLGLRLGEGISGIPVPTRPGKKDLMRQSPLNK